jgi:hypothetical protein
VALWAVGVQIPPPTRNYLQRRKMPPETNRPPGALISPEFPRELVGSRGSVGEEARPLAPRVQSLGHLFGTMLVSRP